MGILLKLVKVYKSSVTIIMGLENLLKSLSPRLTRSEEHSERKLKIDKGLLVKVSRSSEMIIIELENQLKSLNPKLTRLAELSVRKYKTNKLLLAKESREKKMKYWLVIQSKSLLQRLL